MNDIQVEISQKPVEPAKPTGIARRRLLRAGLAAAPVILTVSGRSAMAGTGDACGAGLSPGAWNSLTHNGTQDCIQTSHTVAGNDLGVSPGNWKPNGNGVISTSWPSTCVPYDNYLTATNPNNPPFDATSTRWRSGTKFKDIFIGSTLPYANVSFSTIMLSRPNSAENHLCAAYLNVKTFSNYALTEGEVLELAGGKLGGRTGLTKAQIRAFLDQTWS